MFSYRINHRTGIVWCFVFCVALMLASPQRSIAAEARHGVYDVTQFGAVNDGVTLNTVAIQAAIDACTTDGGGTVLFPPGKFLTGTIYLKDHVRLHLEQGTTILGSTNIADYPVTQCKYPSRSDRYTARALIWGEGLQDVAITGLGVIDGQGAYFRDNVATTEEMAEISQALEKQGRYTPNGIFFNRPFVIRLISCRDVLVENITLRNSAMWMQQYLDCDFVTIRGINVFNHGCRNNDMIDIDGCRNVVISDCFGDTDDDGLTLKSTGARATEHVVITNCILRSRCSAIKAGTESAGGFRDITISNCVILRSTMKEGLTGRPEGLAGIALEMVDGGTLERVSISNIVIEGTTAPIFMRLGNRARPPRPSDPKPPVGVFRNVSISNVVATGASKTGCAIAGIPGHPIENVSLSDIRIAFTGGGTKELAQREISEEEKKYPESTMFGDLPAYGFYFRHVKGLRLNNLDLSYEAPDARPAIFAEDVSRVRIALLNAEAEEDAWAQVVLKNAQDVLLTASVAAAGETFLRIEGACEDIRLMQNDLSRVQNAHVLDPSTPKEAIMSRFNLGGESRATRKE